MKTLNLIIAPQEYKSANHKNLWLELSNNLNGSTLIIDIPADQVITRINNKYYRIDEAKKGVINKGEKISVLRPKFFIRPEILPRIFNKILRVELMNQIRQYYPDLNKYSINVISYSGKWIDILSGCTNAKFYYYILDELELFAHSNKKNKKAIKYDNIGCKNSSYVFTMSEKILQKRKDKCKNIIVVGNGASFNKTTSIEINKYKKSVAFVGNFRNWIDVELFEGIIKERPDINFAIVGPIQDDMQSTFNSLLNNYHNLSYLGNAKKKDINIYYAKFDVVIVPYKQNEFMKATRPIKVVESIFAGTPVVTIPVTGYVENSFIRFATTTSGFLKEIDYLFNTPIDTKSNEYKNFISSNSWNSVANKIAFAILNN